MGSDGLVYIIGGENASGDLNIVQAYSPKSGSWYCSSSVSGCTTTSSPPVAMPTARSRMTVLADPNGLVYAIGGETASGVYTNVVEAYNPTTRTWICSTGDTAPGCSSTTIAPMPTARDVDGDTTSNGLIYLIGGNAGGNLSSVEVFNPWTNTWACSIRDTATSGCSSNVLTDLPTARAGAWRSSRFRRPALRCGGKQRQLPGHGRGIPASIDAGQPNHCDGCRWELIRFG
jgi:hypothetical protein